jgi:GT2 family glycosyltransferase
MRLLNNLIIFYPQVKHDSKQGCGESGFRVIALTVLHTFSMLSMVQPQKPVTAILVAYNSAGVIAQALASLNGESAIEKIIVVDNCSVDDTCELIRRDFPAVELIENPKNDGFGRANNIGLNKTRTEFALLVNPDAVLKEGALEKMLEAANRYPEATILAPELADAQHEPHHSYKRNVFDREKQRDKAIAPSGDLCAEFLSGAVWLLNMRHLKTIGFFDPAIFLYYEDDDLCLRVRQAGNSLVLVHGAHAMHLMGASVAKPKSPEKVAEAESFKQKQMLWSRLYIEEKYHGKKAATKLANKLHLLYSLRAAYYITIGNDEKYNRYRGRIKGINEFTDKPRPPQAA